jgi:hypothetical protein
MLVRNKKMTYQDFQRAQEEREYALDEIRDMQPGATDELTPQQAWRAEREEMARMPEERKEDKNGR